MKFGELNPTSGGAIKVYSDVLKDKNITVRLLLMDGRVFLEGKFRVTTENFIDIPKARVHEWIGECGLSRVDLTGPSDERSIVYASPAAHSTFDLHFAEHRCKGTIRIGSRESSMERPKKIATNKHLAELLAADFYEKGLDLRSRKGVPDRAGWDTLPEVCAVRQMKAQSVPDDVVRLFLTFVSAMDRARDSTGLWRAGMALFGSHPRVFDPGQVVETSFSTLQDLLKEFGVSQRHGHDTRAWRCIATSLVAGDGSHMHRVIHHGIGDALELLKEVDSLPMLRGGKVGPMWIRILAEPGGAKITRLEKIQVAVDVHVLRITENLGVASTRGLRSDEERSKVQEAWYEAAAQADFGGPSRIAGTCAALDPALWSFGKYGCSHCEKAGVRLPIGRTCDHCKFLKPAP